MDQKYWIERKRSSLANAEKATSSTARLVHFELAGRYSVKAANAPTVTVTAKSSDQNHPELLS